MAKYGKAAAKSVEKAVHEKKRGELKSGPGGKGGTVKSRKQAIAIGLSEARAKGAKVPSKSSSSKSSAAKSGGKKTAAKKTPTKKTSSAKKTSAKKTAARKTTKKAS